MTECESKRGSSEVATSTRKFLLMQDKLNKKRIHFFADGYSGQNKNLILAIMLLVFINESKNIEEVSLRYFEPFHGQNEGDSVHSAIEL